ncbi:MAG: hypothetical protein DI570_07485 [Phenylobacterium zucineum]|nr:MAG: hypothetical protein DI570_07485 [Phenylobacterium zucineum]
MRDSDRKRRDTSRRRPTRADVEAHEASILRLTEIHKTTSRRIDWARIEAEGPVAPAIARDATSAAARRKLTDYRPSLMDSLMGLERDKRRELTEKVVEAAKIDSALWTKAKAEADTHNRLLALAPEVRAGKPEAIGGVLKIQGMVAAVRDMVEGLTLHEPTPGRIVARVDLLEYDALPDESCLTGATSAAWVGMSDADRARLQLTNACSLVLRVAVEVLHVAPLEAVEVVARMCRAGGLAETDLHPVLHVKVPLAALAKLQLRKLDAAPTIAAFGARVAWTPADGLAPIDVSALGLGGLQPKPAQAA